MRAELGSMVATRHENEGNFLTELGPRVNIEMRYALLMAVWLTNGLWVKLGLVVDKLLRVAEHIRLCCWLPKRYGGE